MAFELVTKQEAYDALRIGSESDSWLTLWIPAASEAVSMWLKDSHRLYYPEIDSNGEVVVDSNGDPVPAYDSNGDRTVLEVVKAAVLLELASLYRYREGEGQDNVVPSDAGYGYILNKTSTALLTRLRRPTLAVDPNGGRRGRNGRCCP